MPKIVVAKHQFLDSIFAFVDIQGEPIAVDSRFRDADTSGETASMVATNSVASRQGRHQAIGERPAGLFEGAGHLDNHFPAGQSVALATVVAACHRAPVAAIGWSLRGVVNGRSPQRVDDPQLPLFWLRIVFQKANEHFLGTHLFA